MGLMSCILIESKKIESMETLRKMIMKNILMVIPSKKDLRWSDQPQLEKNLMLSKQPLYQVMENLNKSKIMYERG